MLFVGTSWLGGRYLPTVCRLMSGCGSNMGSLAVTSKETEIFHRSVRGGTEPMGRTRIELRCFTSLQDKVLVPQHQSQRTVEHIGPVMPFVRSALRNNVVAACRQHKFISLDPAGTSGQWDHDGPITN